MTVVDLVLGNILLPHHILGQAIDLAKLNSWLTMRS